MEKKIFAAQDISTDCAIRKVAYDWQREADVRVK